MQCPFRVLHHPSLCRCPLLLRMALTQNWPHLELYEATYGQGDTFYGISIFPVEVSAVANSYSTIGGQWTPLTPA